MQETLDKVTAVFRNVFDDDSLVITPQTTAADIDGWDSVMHVSLTLHIEKTFGIRFTSTQIASMNNVGDMVAIIEVRQAGKR
jgi:acyl carrier protein